MRQKSKLPACWCTQGVPRDLFLALLLLENLARTSSAQPASLDITFNPGQGANGEVLCLALQTNGQILIGGSFTSFDGEWRNRVARLNPDGSLDATFLPLVGPDSWVGAIAVEPDDKVIIGGSFSSLNSVPRSRFAKLRVDGSLDLAFPNLDFNSDVTSVQRQSDGRYLVVGGFSSVNGTSRKGVARLLPTGALDTAFNPTARTTNGSVSTAVLQADGKVIIAGSFRMIDDTNIMFISRVNANGSLDPEFDAGYIGGSGISKLVLQPDGKIIVAGSFSSIDGYSRQNIARLNTNGTLDTSFLLPMGLSGSINALALQPDNKCLLGGSFSYSHNPSSPFRYNFARLSSDGSLDSAFYVFFERHINALAVLEDGRIVAAGNFQTVGGTNINHIARLNGDGTAPGEIQLLNPGLYFGFKLSGNVGVASASVRNFSAGSR